jgi:uncharacterized protein
MEDRFRTNRKMVWTNLRLIVKWSMTVPRMYDRMLSQHLAEQRQMAFVAGARQVGKTTTCRNLVDTTSYLNWDNLDDRRLLLAGPAAIAARLGLSRPSTIRPVAVFDELHKYPRWKSLLKGFFDSYGEHVGVIVTGSTRLDVFRRGGDSLMGRYFLYRMHPLSVAELLPPTCSPEGDQATRPAAPLPEQLFQALWEHGGYPEPFAKRDTAFSNRWRRLRLQQLLREDIRDLTRVQELDQLEVLMTLLRERSAGQLIYSTLAKEVNVAVDTIKRWLVSLTAMYFGFLVRPWFKNVAKGLRKEPKWFLSDWSVVEDVGARAETFVACHLLKAVEGFEDLGLGEFELRYVRDKDKREVDFLIIRDRKPWLLVEVKMSDTRLSPTLEHHQRQLGAPHALQVVVNLDYEQIDCFSHRHPVVVPARTFLSQLL